MSAPIRVLIVDDEPPARHRMRALLEAEPDVEVVGEAGDGADAVRCIAELRPDLVFLDVQMPEVDGFGVLARLDAERAPAVVFVTAYDQYALQAFEVHALDYLLKPVDRERFARTLQNVRRRFAADGGAVLDQRLQALLAELRGPKHLTRIPVRIGPRIRLVDVDEIDYLQAEDNYVRLHVADRSYLIRETLTAMQAKLDAARFLRVHRSTIINLSRVRELEPLFGGEYSVVLTTGARLTSSRTYREQIETALELR